MAGPDGVRTLLSQCSSRHSRVVARHKRGHLRRVQVDARVPRVQWVADGGRVVRRALVGRHPGVVDRIGHTGGCACERRGQQHPTLTSLRTPVMARTLLFPLLIAASSFEP